MQPLGQDYKAILNDLQSVNLESFAQTALSCNASEQMLPCKLSCAQSSSCDTARGNSQQAL
eukprot:6014872-Amphidinium_carterae.1